MTEMSIACGARSRVSPAPRPAARRGNGRSAPHAGVVLGRAQQVHVGRVHDDGGVHGAVVRERRLDPEPEGLHRTRGELRVLGAVRGRRPAAREEVGDDGGALLDRRGRARPALEVRAPLGRAPRVQQQRRNVLLHGGQLVRPRHGRHLELVVDGAAHVRGLERRQQHEARLPVLLRADQPRRERLAVADRVHDVDDVALRVARHQEVGVQAVDRLLRRHGLDRRQQSLAQDLPACPLPASARRRLRRPRPALPATHRTRRARPSASTAWPSPPRTGSCRSASRGWA